MKLLREPLVHFLALGLGLFVLFGIVGDSDDVQTGRIEISAARIAQLTEIFTRTWQRPPTDRELTGLIEDHVREEVYYREALAMGLDRDDTIVRRRLRQKLEFFTDDLADAVDPTDEQLETYFEEHAEEFRLPAMLSFRQIYFNLDRRGESASRDAESLLARLNGADAGIATADLGDSLMLPADHDRVSEDVVAREFGNEFAADLTELPVGRWSGPVQSAFGLHLVLVRERESASLPDWTEVRESLDREWRNARRVEASEKFYRALRERYEVSVVRPADGSEENPKLAEAHP
ncbi:MAG: peptidyl-prolyl cis-trans isomerase [bacterium]|nr:peptidyl-prolyl cis-trans isomerase [bacterium]